VLYGSSIIAEFWGLDGYHGALERFDSSGLLWSGASVDPEPLQTPALAGNTVYVREVSRRVHAFDAATGQVRWSTDMSWIDSDIAVAPSRVVLARHDSTDSYLQALDATTGQLAWSVTLDWQTTGEAPVIADGKVFVQQPNGKLRALDLQTGATAWELATERGSSVALAASGDTLYRASLDRLWALDLRTGGKRWKAAVPGGKVRSSNIVLANGVLYYMAKDPFVQGQRLLAVDAATGELLMRGPNAEVPGYNSRIIVADGLVQVVSSTDRGWMVVYGLDSAP
jgi:outer membrane protein assembly factor BamB